MLNIYWQNHGAEKELLKSIFGHKGCVLWLTGLSGSGKSTIATAVEKKLLEKKIRAYVLDGDNIRHGLNSDLSFSDKDRAENIRRISEVANLFADSGIVALVAAISPFARDREKAREIIGDSFIEIFVETDFQECIKRDTKGLYKRALNGEIKNFTGISSVYEIPDNPDITIATINATPEECAIKIISLITLKGII